MRHASGNRLLHTHQGVLHLELLLPWLVLAASLAVTQQLWWGAQENARQDLQARFDFRVHQLGDIEHRMSAYEHVLIGVLGLFIASEHVDRDEFHAYIAALNLAQNYPGMQGVGYAPAVPAGQKASHIAAIRQEGFPGYAIQPEGKRTSYAPLIYIEPFAGANPRAFGYDIHAEPIRHAAMETARDFNRAAITGKLRLVIESGEHEQAGFLMLLPVYRADAPHKTLADRRANILGWVVALFRMDDLMAGIFGEHSGELAIEIYDGGKIADEALLHRSLVQAPDNAKAHFRDVRRIEVAGHAWTVAVCSLPDFEASLDHDKPAFIAIAGIGASLSLALLTWFALHWKQQAALARRYTTAIRTSIDGYLVVDDQGRIVEANAALARMTGYTENELLALGVKDIEAVESPEEIVRHMERVMASGADRFQTHWKHKDGTIVDVEVSATYMRTRGRKYIHAFVQDITERSSREDALRLAATVFSAMNEAVMVTSEDNRIVAVNPAFTAITGYSPDEAAGRNPHMLSSGTYPPAFYDEMYAALAATGCWNGEIVNRRKSGELYNEWLYIKQVHDDKGRLTHHVAVFSDISERKAVERRMHHLAHYDVLTDLPNRTLLTDRLQQALAQARREKAFLALMFIDLDRFKPVNDTLGHAVGDQLLKEVATRLQECVRESDTVSRLGGDEFVVLLPSIDAGRDAMLVAEKILQAIAKPFVLAGHDIHISSSIGIAVYPEHGTDEKLLLKNSDTAMYHAKKSGRNNAKFYEAEMPAVIQ